MDAGHRPRLEVSTQESLVSASQQAQLIAEIRIIGDEIIPVFRLPRDEPVAVDAATPATSTGDGNEPDPVRAMPDLVDRMWQNPE
ncbi:hypothetical protein, partial [Actinoplanes sp. TBRC 11911]|uniref:hypothetical protein n=1 Tax=Actinoplanes sp. TBRC 11911 TaxID=2729386 RepID=UPI001B7D5EEA